MNSELAFAKTILYDPLNYQFSEFSTEKESREYNACVFKLNSLSIKFRTAKITPTKTGQFVTLWKRNSAGITEPCHSSDLIDIYVVNVRKDDLSGQFVFSKSALIKHGILSVPGKEGKRGFRVYPSWDAPTNKQAIRTQQWQLDYFLEIHNGKLFDKERADLLYRSVISP